MLCKKDFTHDVLRHRAGGKYRDGWDSFSNQDLAKNVNCNLEVEATMVFYNYGVSISL